MRKLAIVLLTLPILTVACSSPTPTPSVEQQATGINTTGALAGPASSSAIAVSPDGAIVATANPDSDSVTLINARSLEVLTEVSVGDDPRTLVFTPDSRYLLVANHAGASLSVVDVEGQTELTRWHVAPMPYGVVTDAQHAYVAHLASSAITVIELATAAQTTLTGPSDFPAGVALSSDGQTLAVTHLFSGDITLFDLPSGTAQHVDTGADTNLSQVVVFDEVNQRLLLPQTRSNANNLALVFDATVAPIVNVVSLPTRALDIRARVTLDTADQPVSMPFDVVLTPDANTLYVANASSNDVSVIDLASGMASAHVEVGANPRGLAIAPDGARVFVNNVLDGTVSVIDTSSNEVVKTVVVTEILLAPEILLGKQLFNAALEPRLTTDNWVSCAVCHFDGTTDQRTWLGFPDGPRNTPSLLGMAETLPLHWSGDLNEIADVELTIRNIQAGTGLTDGPPLDSLGDAHTGRSDDLDALSAYLTTLKIAPPPVPPSAEAIEAGSRVFKDLGCASCHAAPLYTDQRSHDVGTGDPALERNSHGLGTAFDTPSLRGLWMTAPYLHDGTAPTLADVFTTGSAHNVLDRVSAEELADLVEFLFALPLE
jgi:YVTN family beta-propeller protein